MNEEHAAFAVHDEPGDLHGRDIDEDAGSPADMPDIGSSPAAAEAESERRLDGEAPKAAKPGGFTATADEVPDPITAAVLAPDAPSFLRSLVAASVQAAHAGAADQRSLGAILSQLGEALEEGLDEELTCRELIDALERRRLAASELQHAVPIVSALVARILAQAKLCDQSTPLPVEAEALVHAAEKVVAGALSEAGIQAWRPLPAIAAAIAPWARRHGLSVATLAEALPRLVARLGRQREAVSDADRRRGEFPRGEAGGEPRRMVLSGPVEIVFFAR